MDTRDEVVDYKGTSLGEIAGDEIHKQEMGKLEFAGFAQFFDASTERCPSPLSSYRVHSGPARRREGTRARLALLAGLTATLGPSPYAASLCSPLVLIFI